MTIPYWMGWVIMFGASAFSLFIGLLLIGLITRYTFGYLIPYIKYGVILYKLKRMNRSQFQKYINALEYEWGVIHDKK